VNSTVKIPHAISALPRRLRTLSRQPWRRKALLPEALTMLAVARVWLIARPFQSVASSMTVRERDAALSASHDLDAAQTELAREISIAVRWVARFTPFRAVCIQQAIAARLMLRRRGIPSIMYFGVCRKTEDGESKLAAHAWLQSGTVEVTGFDLAGEYTEIARFE